MKTLTLLFALFAPTQTGCGAHSPSGTAPAVQQSHSVAAPAVQPSRSVPAALLQAALREAFTARYQPFCDALLDEPVSVIERIVQRSGETPYKTSSQADPDAPTGSLSRAHIRAVIESHLDDIRACYIEALHGWPGASGRVTVRFGVGPSGSIEAVAVVANGTPVGPLSCCVAHVLALWSFAPPEGGGIVVVTYPFTFELTDAAKSIP